MVRVEDKYLYMFRVEDIYLLTNRGGGELDSKLVGSSNCMEQYVTIWQLSITLCDHSGVSEKVNLCGEK